MQALLVIGIVVFFVGVSVLLLVWSRRVRKRHTEGMSAAAASLGLQFSPTDPSGLGAWPFDFFRRARGRALNVAWGPWRGRQLAVFDYEYMTGSYEHQSRKRASCALVQLPAALPELVISRETTATRIADRVGLADIQLGHQAFDAAFTLKSSDPDFARELMAPELQQYLLDQGTHWRFETTNGGVLGIVGGVHPSALSTVLDGVVGFVDRMPEQVLERFGAPPATR